MEKDMSDDRRWLEALRDEFRPEPMSPQRAAALRRALDERIERRARARAFALPALASATIAAITLWVAWPLTTPTAVHAAATSAEIDEFVDPDRFASEVAERGDYLPADYQGLALLLDDDAADR
jgi:hypothetical protein